MKITFIGTVGSALTKELTYSSILIDDSLLLDCGEGTTQKLISLNCINSIENICLTHLHNDHFLGIFSMLWYYWIISQRKNALKIIGPPNTDSTITSILKLINTPDDAIKFDLKFEILRNTDKIQIFKLLNYNIKSIRVVHTPIAFAYRIENINSKKSICYVGDSSSCENIINLAKKCDVLICESTFPDEYKKFAHKYGHCTPSDAAEIANQAEIKTLILTHISAVFQNEKDLNRIKNQAENKFKNKIIIAKDLMTLKI